MTPHLSITTEQMFARWLPDLFPIRDPVLIFAIVLVLFLLAPIVMGRVRLPGMIGLLLAGAILGPHALGILARDASFILLGAVGLIYIMFTAALEVDLSVFRKYGVQGVVFGILTFCVPQGLGTLMAYHVLGFDWLPAILLASMFASHTLLAYPLVSRLGLSSNQAVTTTLGGTMITDTAALLVLAVIAGMATGEVNEAFWWRLGVSLVVFVSAILIGLPRLGRWFFRRVAEDGPAEFVFVLTSVFLCAALSHAAGLEPIVGAFLAGLALNRLIPHSSPLMNRLTFTGEAIFIPFFLLSVGMLLDARVLFGGLRTWFVAIAMTVTVIVTKWLAARVAAAVFRYKPEEGRVMFGLSVVQAAATLAAVMVGHRIELFDDTVVNGTIVMILVTCILGPAVVGRAAPILAKALRALDKDEPRQARGVLVPLASADQAGAAVELALLLRGPERDFPIFPAFIASEGEELSRSMADGEKVLAAAVSEASSAACIAQPIKRVHDRPGRALILARKELGARHVVVPWDAAPSKSGNGEGRIVDELLADRAANLFLSRLPHPLGTCERVVVLVPPEARNLATAAPLITQIGKALGASVLVLCHERDEPALREIFPESSGLRTSYAVYPSARMWLALVADQIRDSDLVIVLGARSPSASQRELRGAPQRLAARYPEIALIVLYPAEPMADEADADEALASTSRPVAAGEPQREPAALQPASAVSVAAVEKGSGVESEVLHHPRRPTDRA
jgi:Kef-type K+ transport system membrane component KefB